MEAKITKYDKLVRDRILEIIRADGKEPVSHIADGKEYWEKLKQKLAEEVTEFFEAENELEMADVLEVIKAIMKFKGFDEKEVEKIRLERREKRGGFEEKIILEEVRE